MTRGEHTPGIVDLLPCPFCGSDSVGFKDTGLPDTLAGCNGCGATVPWKESRAEAVAAWNTRPDADLISELVGALEGAVHFADAVAYRSDPLSVALRQWLQAGEAVVAKAKARGGAE